MQQIPEIKLRLNRLQIPEYTFGEYGDWTLRPCHVSEGPAEVFDWGYATGPQWEPAFPVLTDAEGRRWMSANRLEQESQATHLASAHGTVVVCGVGIGMYLYNVVQKSEVQRVFAVDLDQTVIDMVRQNAERHGWPEFQKVVFLQGDARLLTRRDLSLHGVQSESDFVYVDIWPTLADKNTVVDSRTIAANLNPRAAGFWGQELALLDWATEVRDPPVQDPDQLTLDNFDEWCLALDMVMQIRSVDYLRYALVCWLNQKARVEYNPNVRKRSK